MSRFFQPLAVDKVSGKALAAGMPASAEDHDDKKKTQSIDQLTQELAYEYWHRMLFARFLAENHLLMHPDGVAVSLEECDELAKSAGAPNGFVLAARYASRMLPQVFRTDDVLLEIESGPEQRLALEKSCWPVCPASRRRCSCDERPGNTANQRCCLYCGKAGKLTLEHVVPQALGGTQTTKSVCASCNNRIRVTLVLRGFVDRRVGYYPLGRRVEACPFCRRKGKRRCIAALQD